MVLQVQHLVLGRDLLHLGQRGRESDQTSKGSPASRGIDNISVGGCGSCYWKLLEDSEVVIEGCFYVHAT